MLITACLLIFTFLMFKDEPLNPIAKEWLIDSTIENNPIDNGFYYLIGLKCNEGENPFNYGFDLVMNNNNLYSEEDQINISEITNIVDDIPFENILQFCINNKKDITSLLKKFEYGYYKIETFAAFLVSLGTRPTRLETLLQYEPSST